MRGLLVGVQVGRIEGLARALADHGHTAVVAPSSAAALQMLEAEPVALIVLQQRPELDASEACRALRKEPASAKAVILVMLAEADVSILESALDAGADDFFFDTPGDIAFRARLRVVERAMEAGASHREANDDLDIMFEMAIDLLCVAGLDGRFRRTSPSWTQALGWTQEELCSRPWLDFVHPDDVATTIAAGEQLGQGATLIAFANRYRSRDGSYRWLEWRVVPAVDRGLVYASARDVTEDREQREALRNLADNLSTTLSSIGDGVISVTVDAVISRMNPVAEELTGWTERAARGRPIAEIFRIINTHSRATVENPVAAALRENRVVGLANDTLLVRRDNTEIPIADSCAPIKSATGAVSGAVLVFRDMTAELAARVAQEHVQRQLVFADRMASVGTLAAGMAHEINNPLSYVSANLDLVLEEIRELGGGSSSARMRDLEDMVLDAQKGADRIQKIVRGLKTFSRTEEERRSVVSVRDVLDLAINMTFNEIRHRARLIKDYGETPLVQADDARLGQVFINLLVNAAHSITTGSVDDNVIRILTSTDPSGGAVIEVRDTGAGIPAALLERIFDPFFTTKPVGIGTGLGLSICHNIITNMGGTITVDSKVGSGTQFKVVLPAASAEELIGVASSPSARNAVAKRASVLVVDDEPAVGITLSRVLRAHHVITSTSAHDALEIIGAGKHFDVILSDLMMPEMSGIEFYEQLAARYPQAAEKVVFISGGAFTMAADAFLDTIPNERLDKPFDPKVVRELVQRFVK